MYLRRIQSLHKKWAWCKSGTRTPGPRETGIRDPGPPSKFKIGTRDPLQNLKVGPQESLSLKV